MPMPVIYVRAAEYCLYSDDELNKSKFVCSSVCDYVMRQHLYVYADIYVISANQGLDR